MDSSDTMARGLESPFLLGDLVYLRPHTRADLASSWYQWFNDRDVTRYMFKGAFPNTDADQSAFLASLEAGMAARTMLQLAIVERATGRFVGVISLNPIDWVSRSAEIAMVIGEERDRRRGFGLEAMALLTHHAFTKMNLHRLWAGQHSQLERWREALDLGLGYTTEGRMREAIFTEGRYHDVLIIGILAQQWLARVEAHGSVAGILDAARDRARGDAVPTALTTARLRIVPFAQRHLTPRYVSWLNDPEVVRHSEQRHHAHTMESCRAYWNSFRGTPHLFWAIESLDPDVGHIGNITAHVDPANGVADVGILIGDRVVWGKGYGTEAWNVVVDHLLALPGIRKVTAGTLAVNEGMLRVMKKSGMLDDGRRFRHAVWEGREADIVHVARFRPPEAQGSEEQP